MQPILTSQGSLGIRWPIRRQALHQVVAEPLNTQMHVLDRTLVHVDVVDRDPINPRLELTAEIELPQSRDGSNQDLLRRIFRILMIPQHAQGEAVDVALKQ